MSRPYFNLYGRDFRDGVRPLTLEETGAYTLLLTLIYDAGGPIPDDAEAIRRQLGCDRRVWARVRVRLLDLGKLVLTDDGKLSNGRAEREIANQVRLSEVRSEAGRAGGARSGEARRLPQKPAYGTSSGKVGQKSGKSPADFLSLPPLNPLFSQESSEAIASKPKPEPEYNPSTLSAHARAGEPPPERPPPDTPANRSQVLARCVAAAGPGLADPAKEPALHLTAPRLLAALAAGCDLEADVLPVIAKRTASPRASPITTWAYFEGAWIDARDKRLAQLPAPDPTRFTGDQNGPPRQAQPPRTAADQIREDRYASWGRVLSGLSGVEVVGRPALAFGG